MLGILLIILGIFVWLMLSPILGIILFVLGILLLFVPYGRGF